MDHGTYNHVIGYVVEKTTNIDLEKRPSTAMSLRTRNMISSITLSKRIAMYSTKNVRRPPNYGWVLKEPLYNPSLYQPYVTGWAVDQARLAVVLRRSFNWAIFIPVVAAHNLS